MYTVWITYSSSSSFGATSLYEFKSAQQFPSMFLCPEPSYSNSVSSLSPYPLDLSSYPYLGLPNFLTALRLHSLILLTVLFSSILTICQTHFILCVFIRLTTSASLVSKSISSLILILHLPSWFWIGPCILLVTPVSNNLNYCSCMCFTTEVSHPYVTTSLTRLLKMRFL